jgi:hypothetical protein
MELLSINYSHESRNACTAVSATPDRGAVGGDISQTLLRVTPMPYAKSSERPQKSPRIPFINPSHVWNSKVEVRHTAYCSYSDGYGLL